MRRPTRAIAPNAGMDGAVIVEKVRNSEGNVGYNARDEKFEDLVAAGVVDPAEVTRSALQNAASIASLLLTTESLVAEIPEPKPAMPGGGPGCGGMGGSMGF